MATNKQKALAKKIAENPSLPMKTAMMEVGYAENTAIAPRNVTESKAWPELLEKYLPDDKVLSTHEAGLEANKIISAKIIGNANENTDDFIEVPDHPTRLKAVELAYKVKGKLRDAQVNILNQGGDMSLEFSGGKDE